MTTTPLPGGTLLARLGGAHPDILRRTKDEMKYAAMGGVLISTAVVAAASAAFALSSTLGLGTFASILAGLAWGAVILNLDRMLIVSMGRQNAWWRNVLTAIPRLALAVLIGAVISTPLTLEIFGKEIRNEIVVLQAEDRLRARDSRATEFDQPIAGLEQRVNTLGPVADGRSRPSTEGEPDVAAARNDVARLNDDAQLKATLAACEKDGRVCPGANGVPGTTGVAGDGDEYRNRRDQAAAAAGELRAAQGRLTAIRQNAQTRLDQNSGTAAQRAADELRVAQGDLASLRAARDQATNASNTATANDDGLLAQLEALDRLSRDSGLMRLAHLALFLLFMAIEVLPVLVKLLTGFGPPNTYETMLAEREADALVDERERKQRLRDRVQARAHVGVVLEKDRAQKQVDSGRRMNEALVATQEQISLRAITVWAAVAQARSDDELHRWFRQHGGVGPLPTPASTPATTPAPATPAAPAPPANGVRPGSLPTP